MSLTAAQAELASFTQVRTGSAVPLSCTELQHALPVAARRTDILSQIYADFSSVAAVIMQIKSCSEFI